MSTKESSTAPAGSTLPSPVRDALEHAAALRLLAVLFERPRAGWLEELDAVAAAVTDPELVTLAALARDASEGAYHALLGAGGAVPGREVAYCTYEDPGRVLAELRVAHEAFAYVPSCTTEPVDHLCIETDFAAYLYLKEAYALMSGDEQAAQVTQAARERFTKDRLAPFAQGFARRLGGGGPAYLVAAAHALTRQVPLGPWANATEGVDPEHPALRKHLPLIDPEEDFGCA